MRLTRRELVAGAAAGALTGGGIYELVDHLAGSAARRRAVDGVLPDGTRLKFEQGDRGQGFNAVLHVTHRQNFIVPPRRHRSFPLVELLA